MPSLHSHPPRQAEQHTDAQTAAPVHTTSYNQEQNTLLQTPRHGPPPQRKEPNITLTSAPCIFKGTEKPQCHLTQAHLLWRRFRCFGIGCTRQAMHNAQRSKSNWRQCVPEPSCTTGRKALPGSLQQRIVLCRIDSAKPMDQASHQPLLVLKVLDMQTVTT